MSDQSRSNKPRFLPLPNGRLSLHSGLFLIFNLAYFVPLFGVMLFSYSQGGVSKAADLDADVMRRISLVYVLGIGAFLLGSRLGPVLSLDNNKDNAKADLRMIDLTPRFKTLCVITVVLFVLSKWSLIQRGVYSDYAFDADSMEGGIWTFSMFCSELLLLLSIVVLFSSARRSIWWFLTFTAINGINLLHGTRIFFLISSIVLCVFLYVRGKFKLRYAIVGLVGMLLIGYAIFLLRSHMEVDEDQTLSAAGLVSPAVFESVFSQLSLIGTIRHPEAWNLSGSPYYFFRDSLYFITPRFLLPGKDQLLYVDQFTDLSPLGAFSGYAQGIIYFGVFFPIFYLIVGYTANWLQRRAKYSQLCSAIYLYFACDFLFRIMRDGYVIPIKMLVNAFVVMLCVISLGHSRAVPKRNPTFAPSPAPNLGNSMGCSDS
jgi:hypothetical protein